MILDLDNTLYDWFKFWATSFRAMVHTINKNTNIEESIIYDAFRKLYKKHGCNQRSGSLPKAPV